MSPLEASVAVAGPSSVPSRREKEVTSGVFATTCSMRVANRSASSSEAPTGGK